MPDNSGARYARGTQRRNALIKAAADVLLDQGLAALSHRAVAARAGLPLASTTYYFASADDLRDEGLRHLTDGWAARAGAVVDALPDQLDAARAAQAVTEIIGADAPDAQLLLMYERYLEAGRHQRLRALVIAWNARLAELVRQVLLRADLPADEGTARLVVAVADGVAVTALAEGTSPQAAVGEAVNQMLSLLQVSAGGALPLP
jgi:DNA-binding transcriptional regulator YbjK